MTKKKDGELSYVAKVGEETRRFARELLDEHQKVQVALARAESEREALRSELQIVKAELERRNRDWEALERQLSDAANESRKFLEQYVELEQQNTNLANLYVASYQLHGTLDRQRVLQAIQEIVINLVGSEEVGIFEVDERGTHLTLVASFGIDSKAFQSIPLGKGLIGRAAVQGELYLPNGSPRGRMLPGEDRLTVCIPLALDGLAVGAIAIFRLLGQKNGLDPVDHELFELLGRHAASALYCTGLHARVLAAGAEQ